MENHSFLWDYIADSVLETFWTFKKMKWKLDSGNISSCQNVLEQGPSEIQLEAEFRQLPEHFFSDYINVKAALWNTRWEA